MTWRTDFGELGKTDFSGNPDDLSTYTLASWEHEYVSNFVDRLLVPMDGRDDSRFYRR
jgi:hypothetical protein